VAAWHRKTRGVNLSFCLILEELAFQDWSAPQVDVDVGSSTTASSVVGLVAGAVKSLVIDMAIVLQARSPGPLLRSPL